MTATLNPAPASPAAPSAPATDPVDVEVVDPVRAGRAKWPLFGAVGAVAGWAAALLAISNGVTEKDAKKGVDVVDKLHPGGYHAGFLIGLVSVGCLLMAAAGWKRWAERRAPDDLAARTIGQGLALTGAVNIIFFCLMGSMADYLPGGADQGWLSKEGIFTNYTLLDFGALLGWWAAAVSAICVAHLALRKQRILPRWMGVVSVLLLLPPVAMAIGTGLPGFIGMTMPIWLVAISVGMVFSKTAKA
jgi:hypothetical protein